MQSLHTLKADLCLEFAQLDTLEYPHLTLLVDPYWLYICPIPACVRRNFNRFRCRVVLHNDASLEIHHPSHIIMYKVSIRHRRRFLSPQWVFVAVMMVTSELSIEAIVLKVFWNEKQRRNELRNSRGSRGS